MRRDIHALELLRTDEEVVKDEEGHLKHWSELIIIIGII